MENKMNFYIELDFLSDEDDPLKVFESFKLMIESQISIQSELLKAANPLGHISFTLSEIQKSSILASMTRSFINVESEKNELFDSMLKGNMNEYIDQSNKIILNKLSESKTEAFTKTDIKNILSEIDMIADKTGVKENANFKLPAGKKIIEGITKAKEAVDTLPNRTYTFNPAQTKIEISKINLDITEQSSEQKLIEQCTKCNMILKIKLADFLGESKWKFITPDNIQIDAKILDKDWLERFHQSEEHLASGDSLDVEVDIKETNNQKNEYTIMKVNKVISDEKQREFEM